MNLLIFLISCLPLKIQRLFSCTSQGGQEREVRPRGHPHPQGTPSAPPPRYVGSHVNMWIMRFWNTRGPGTPWCHSCMLCRPLWLWGDGLFDFETQYTKMENVSLCLIAALWFESLLVPRHLCNGWGVTLTRTWLDHFNFSPKKVTQFSGSQTNREVNLFFGPMEVLVAFSYFLYAEFLLNGANRT